MNIGPPPIQSLLTSPAWASWFAQVFKVLRMVAPSMSADRGDNSITIKVAEDALTQVYGIPLTAPRTVTLSSVNAFVGAKFRVLRKASATGGSGLDVGPGLKTLSAGTWCDVEYAGNAWILTASGSL